MTRFKCICAYDGTDFDGWQSQRSGTGVQDHIEHGLLDLLKTPTRIHGSGRTDSGVHARGQVFHFDAEWSGDADQMQRGLNTKMPEGIRVLECRIVSDEFHARYSVKKKRYVYYINKQFSLPTERLYCWDLCGRGLNVDAMKAACEVFLGVHDFTAFAAKSDNGNPVKEIMVCEIGGRGDKLKVSTEGSGYLYKMVRSMVGGLVEVGLGKLSVERMTAILKSRVRTREIPTAPAKGLFLDQVWYR